jgi:phosphopantothenoylcysteine decarboxylase / phosphopantothenate---cysteine ligase
MSKGKILFQLSGSIACFKACQVISRLSQSGYDLEIVATKSALEFVGEATLEGLTGKRVHTDTFARGAYMNHIHLIRWADLVIVCPATANTLNKLAAGVADDLLSTLFLAHDFRKPYLIAPAMNTHMLRHPATRASIDKLRSWGIEILESGSGSLACGEVGEGRLLEPDALFSEIEARLHRSSTPLEILITSGGTKEPIDGVRSIGNTSTGRTGAEIAEYFLTRGHHVTLLRSADSVSPSLQPTMQRTFNGYGDLSDALSTELATKRFDAVIHAAAVSDYLVSEVLSDGKPIGSFGQKGKIGKIDSDGELMLRLTRSPKLVDRLREMSINPGVKIVAFKLTNTETMPERLEAVRKLASHARPEFIVHNDLHDIDTKSGTHGATIYSGLDPENPVSLAKTTTKQSLAATIEHLLLKGVTS